MALDKPLDGLTEADLAELITAGMPELKTLEYKQTLSGTSDADRKEFLADVSSFANSSGGHLIYGVRADAGAAAELVGINEESDPAILRMESAIRDGIAPRIAGIHSVSIKLAGARAVIVMRIPKSFAAPHMVKFKGTSRFYARTSNGKYQLDVGEIRSAFLGSETTEQRIRDFKLDRISRIRGRETSVPLLPGPRIVLHIIPVSSFGGRKYDVIALKKNAETNQRLAPLFRSFANYCEINFDGIVLSNGDRSKPSGGYCQLYRNGIIEAVDAMFIPSGEQRFGKLISGYAFEEGIFKSVRGYLSVLKSLAVDTPVLLTLTLTDVKDFTMAKNSESYRGISGGTPFGKEVLMPQALMLETYDVDVCQAMKPLVDEIWNAAGEEESPNHWTG